MKKIGKHFRYISSETKDFSRDPIRRLISVQDQNTYTNSLDSSISIASHTENYIPPTNPGESGRYEGKIVLNMNQVLVNRLQEIIQSSKPVITTTVDNPNYQKINPKIFDNIRDILNRSSDISTTDISTLFNNSDDLVAPIRAAVIDAVKAVKERGYDERIVENLGNFIQSLQKKQEEDRKLTEQQLEMAGAEIGARTGKIEDLMGFNLGRDRGRNRYPRPTTPNTSQNTPQTPQRTFEPPTITVTSFGKSVLFDVNFIDLCFSQYKHYDPLEEETVSNLDRILKFKASLEYNFLIRNYENFLKEHPNLSILNLPYFYEILEFKLAGNVPELSDYDGIQGTFTDANSAKIENTSFLNKPEEIISLNGVRTDVSSLIINSNMGISETEIVSLDKYLNKYNAFKEQFPFYSEITIDLHQDDQENFSKLFHDYNLYSKFLSEMKNNSIVSSLTEVDIRNNVITNNLACNGYLINEKFFENIFSSNIVNDPSLFFNINSLLDKYKRNFKDVLLGKESPVEIVGYHLQKFNGFQNTSTATPLQEWYLPNLNTSYMQWIDTQIKYGEEYTYQLKNLVLAVGNSYSYSNWSDPSQDAILINNNQVTIYYIHKPELVVYDLQSSMYNNLLLDKPPVEPDLSIIPYVGIDNKILLNINTGIGKYKKVPISSNDAEIQLIEKLKQSQNIPSNENMLMFESDEPSDEFQIFRLNNHPTSYQEIFNNFLTSIPTNGSTAAAYTDMIQPNKKYYYCVRSIDYHKNFSNLSKIFQLELVNDNGTIYPIVEVVELDKKQNLLQDFKSFRRYLKVSPSLLQKLVNQETVNSTGLQMGLSQDTIWNKNMKIRLISKQTGRKIDLNFKFNYDIKHK